MIYEYKNDNADELLLNLREEDIVQIHAEDFFRLIGKSGKPKGRKPIAFDEDKFIEVVSRWQSGAITARAAMQEVNLKPNTFYRRVKEYTEMEDIKEIRKAIKKEARDIKASVKEEAKDFKAAVKAEEKEIKANLKAEKEEMKEFRAQVKAEAKDLKKQLKEDAKEAGDKVEDTISLKKMEKEILKEKLGAELDHAKEVKALEKEVAAEAEELKSIL